jgi:uncharacterized membrane protein
MVLVALLVAGSFPTLASVLLTVGAWIKVSPGAVLLPLFVVVKRRWRDVVLPAAVTCAVVIGLAWVLRGSLRTLFSFLGEASGRGLQIESVLATPVVLGHAIMGEEIWTYNDELSTVETWGPVANAMARVGDVALPLAAVAVAVLVWRARTKAADALVTGTLAMLATMIVTNKVGSPQFMAWLAPAIVVALIRRRDLHLWALVAAITTAIAALTMLIYPLFYYQFLDGEAPMLAVYVVRNLALVIVWVIALVELFRIGSRARREAAANSTPPSTPQEPPA